VSDRQWGPGTWRDKLINAQVLCDRRFSEVRYVVPGLFPEGVTVLASRPKIGKSWLLLQITTAVASGTTTLVANDQPIQGDVLYLALEDNQRRLQRRLTKYFGLSRENWPAHLKFAINWRRLDQGGLDDLREWCASVTSPRLIAIDTLQKVRPAKGKGQSDYDADYAACEGLQKLAGDVGVAIIVAHHDRKMDAEDVFDTVSGTLGLTGAVDTVALIKRRTQGTTLHIEGRDLVELIEKAISFDQDTCRWNVLGEATEVLRSAERSRVLKALADAPQGLSPLQIAAMAELPSRNAAERASLDGAEDVARKGRGPPQCNAAWAALS
jgi:RecA-family ATPase